MRSIVYRFEDLRAFSRALHGSRQELPLPPGETLAAGEWVLAMFELGASRRATAAAGRGTDRSGAVVVSFETRDWERLLGFSVPKHELSQEVDDSGEPTDPMRTEPNSVDLTTKSRVPAELRALRSQQQFLEPHSTPEVSLSTSGRHAAAQGARVLLVDDDPAVCDVVCAMLEAVGLLVAAVPNGEEALERVRSKAFHLVVLDWNLPGMTGLDLCRTIREEPGLGYLPVLFLTANASQKDLVEAFASGADDYVLKPFRAPELGARIFGLLRRARMSVAP